MSELKICRICVRTNIKMYKFDRYQLKCYYEEIMASKMSNKDGLPHYFCFECATMLHKFHKFKEKCYRGQNTLKDVLWKGIITIHSISKLNRHSKDLQSHLDVIKANSKVKTFCIKNSKHTKPVKRKKREINKIEHIEIDNNDDLEDDHLDNDIVHDLEINDNEKELNNIDEINTNDITIPNEQKTEFDNEKTEFDNEKTEFDNEKTELDNEKTEFDNEKTEFDNEKIEVDNEKSIVTNTVTHKRQSNTKKFKKKIKTKKRVNIEIEKRFQSTKKRKNFLDVSKWEKISLTEEEALQVFRSRSQESRYLYAAYKCTDCYKGFSKEEILSRHLQLTHSASRGQIECRFCRARFKWKSFLRPHMLQHYTKYKCLQCGKLCAQESTAYFHEQYHKGVTRKCMHCGEEFGHSSTYYTHLRTHRSEHVCAACGASFVSEAGLHQHKKVKHVADLQETPEENQLNSYCERCDIKFETHMAYEKHLVHSAMHADGLESNGTETKHSSTDKKKRQARRSARKPTTCYICNRHFETQQACLQHHLKVHPRTPFHSPSERHICEICGVSLAPMSVPIHMNIHTREKLYTCNTCGAQFSCKSTLNRHHVTHTGEKKFGCSMCDKRFTQSGSMKLHYRTFHLKEPYPKRNRSKKLEVPQEY